MDNANILLRPVFLPLIAGFVLLFITDRFKALHKLLTLIIAAVAFITAMQIYTSNHLEYAIGLLEIDNFKLDLLFNPVHGAAPHGRVGVRER